MTAINEVFHHPNAILDLFINCMFFLCFTGKKSYFSLSVKLLFYLR